MKASRGTSALCALLMAGCVAVASFCLPGSAAAADVRLSPQTKVRLTVVQWMPMKGQYERWEALGGEFIVSDAGTLSLPVIGSVPVGTLDNAGLAAEISKRLQAKTGMVAAPDTTVEVVEYPPIYVVGDVNTPGQYKFRDGLTVLQALALSGGELRSGAHSETEIRLVGELQGFDNDILRSSARVARLGAEMSDAKEISFPPALAGSNRTLADEVFAQEKIIFQARANELERQTKSLSDLRDLFSAEIKVLEEKIKAADDGIASAEKELSGVSVLVEKGIAVASRKSDLERVLSNYRAERLDQVTAVMRARQGITEATRNLDGLRDKMKTDVASELQTEQASLDESRLKRDTSQRLLLELLASSKSGQDKDAIAFSITRRESGRAIEVPATELTSLIPGDVVKITLANRPDVEPAGTRRPVAAASEVSQ
ncbi:polysaccharide export outer membrane protein [Mesorhizobium albiziae]|uniref:Polysaccharide export outer membrane protein n=1 Tax=Neomesorhizobium albiziae TaxID=335020 RepID=A0A1I3XKM7_9HYPH|nr:polysaccharide biosynthesis/export family protein [Mesorhizobium albiziae]GLS30366.1 exopolysaccharide biosynthesis protein [Mesorhizobium albiziae]SFK20038.1 polysaccharide export outer membrane protein [Mesorhizobium albiziae]